MKTSTDITALKGSGTATAEQAQRAVKAFRALQPTLTSYARVLTKRTDVRVEMAAQDNGSTDGTRIFFRPPIALGDNIEHVRSLCGKRDSASEYRCAACAVRESVLVTIYHEIAHIAFESFAEVDDAHAAEVAADAALLVGGAWATGVAERIRKAPSYQKRSYIAVCNLVSPFMPLLWNALEDARVNAEMFKARPGTKVMFDSDTTKIFRDGVEQVDPATGEVVVKKWDTYPLNMQILVGLFCKASDYKYDGWFAPQIERDLGDSELRSLVNQLVTIRSAAGVYNLSFPILHRLRELGYCKTDDEPEEPQPDEKSEEKSEEKSDEKTDDRSEGSDVSRSEDDSSAGGSGDDDSEEEKTDDSTDESSPGESPQDSEPADADSSGSDSEDSGDKPDDSEAGDTAEGGSPAPGTEDTGTSDPESNDGSGESENSGGSCETDSESSSESGTESDSPGTDVEENEGGSVGSQASSGGSESSPSGHLESEDDEEMFDTGADNGQGGTEVIEDDDFDDDPIEMGSPEDVKMGLLKFGDHEDKPKTTHERKAEEAVDTAIIQGLYFETPSRNVSGVREHRYGVPHIVDGFNFSQAWDESGFYSMMYGSKSGKDSDTNIPESVLGPALLRMRVAFSDNERGHNKQHLKSGKVNGRVLGKRAHLGDPRLFRKKVQPGKKSYCVIIGMDVSGSTVGRNLHLEKRAVMAQAMLCQRMGISFAIYAHSGNYWQPGSGRKGGFALDVYIIKEANEPWDGKTQERLEKLGPDSANLDGHFLEYLRKRADERLETDCVILYYSDGKMPAENHDEELAILQREIKYCAQKNYTLLGVGIRTDSPARHGLDTVQVDSDEDVGKVVRHLERRLVGNLSR